VSFIQFKGSSYIQKYTKLGTSVIRAIILFWTKNSVWCPRGWQHRLRCKWLQFSRRSSCPNQKQSSGWKTETSTRRKIEKSLLLELLSIQTIWDTTSCLDSDQWCYFIVCWLRPGKDGESRQFNLWQIRQDFHSSSCVPSLLRLLLKNHLKLACTFFFFFQFSWFPDGFSDWRLLNTNQKRQWKPCL